MVTYHGNNTCVFSLKAKYICTQHKLCNKYVYNKGPMNKKTILIFTLLLLQGCMPNLSSLNQPTIDTIVIPFEESLNAEQIVYFTQGFTYEVLALPDTSIIGDQDMRIQLVDQAGSSMTIIVPVTVVDITRPVIRLNGDTIVNVPVYASWNDPGITFSDNADGQIVMSDAVLRQNNWSSGVYDLNTVGTYEIHYTAYDTSNNASNVLVRTVNVIDQIPPVITTTNYSVVFTDQQILLNDIQVSDNYDELSLRDLEVDWGELDPMNPKVGSYTVLITLTDKSNNQTRYVRRYEVIHSASSLQSTLDGYVNQGEYDRVIELINIYKNYSIFNQSRLSDLEIQYKNLLSYIILQDYNLFDDSVSIEQRIEYLIANNIFLDVAFVRSEMDNLVNSKTYSLLSEQDYETALLITDQYERYMSESQYRNIIRNTISRMVSTTTFETEVTHRTILNRYATVLGGENNINYRSYLSTIVRNTVDSYLDERDLTSAFVYLQQAKDLQYLGEEQADEMAREFMVTIINQRYAGPQTQISIINLINQLPYKFTFYNPQWYIRYIENLSE